MVRQWDAQRMCREELEKHGLWQQGWRWDFSKTTTFIAACFHNEKRIVISLPHLHARGEAELLDTIRHEIAHALAGHSAGHGPLWVEKAIELGCKPNPCAPSNVDGGRALSVVQTRKEQKIKSINSYCPICGKIAIEVSRVNMGTKLWLKLECGHFVGKDKIKSIDDEIANWTNESGTKHIYPYQVEGIKFIAHANGRCLIADEPGLGKTMQALGALKFYPEMRPCLWVCKATLKLQAIKDAMEWGGLEFMGQIIEHGKMFIIPNLNIYVISMDLLRRMPREKLEEIPYKTVVADEIQHFKDHDSARTNELRSLVSRAEYFIPLSGTPWKNRGSEYFPVLNMLRPELFPSPKHFKNHWVGEYYDSHSGKFREGGIKDIPYFREFTKDFIIRRMRDDVLPDLPKVDRRIRFVDMDEEIAKRYDKEESVVAAMLKEAILEGKPPKMLAPMIMRLKHITGQAKAPAVVDDAIEWLENVPDDFEKLTIFTHHIDVADMIQNGYTNPKTGKKEFEGLDKWLKDNDYNKSLRVYGGRTAEEREAIKMKFMNNPNNRVLVASTLASGEGLNLQFCQNAYMCERQWNPQNEEQAEFRFSRPFTKSDYPEYLHPLADRKVSIRIPYFIAVNTIDEMLTNIVERKRHNFRKSMNEKDIDLIWDENDIIKELTEAIIKKRYGKKG